MGCASPIIFMVDLAWPLLRFVHRDSTRADPSGCELGARHETGGAGSSEHEDRDSSFRYRISPVFDAARRLLLVDIEDGREVGRTEEVLEKSQLAPRASRIAELHTDVLICGAISQPLEAMLISAGVEVIPQTCGQVEEVLQAFVSGQLTGDAFVMPGCCGRRRQFQRRS